MELLGLDSSLTDTWSTLANINSHMVIANIIPRKKKKVPLFSLFSPETLDEENMTHQIDAAFMSCGKKATSKSLER